MLLLLVLITALAYRAASGQGIRSLGDVHIRGESSLLIVLILVSLLPLVASRFGLGRSATLATWLLLMVGLLALCLLNAQRSQGFVLMAAGVLMNLLAISLNLGMPVSPSAIEATGAPAPAVVALGSDVFHVAQTTATKVLMFADVIPLPGPRGFRAVLSIGDVLMLVGVILVVAVTKIGRHSAD